VAAPLFQVRPTRHGRGGGGGTPAGYSPAQISHAYGFDKLTSDGRGVTIAIVDAYDDPNIQSDLNTFSTNFGLPTTSSNQFTFTKAYAQGSQPVASGSWAQEISLDVEWAHAIAPRANILLVEAADSSFINLLGAVDYAVRQRAPIVSMSWGTSDFSGASAYDSHFNVPGVTFLAASGDTGGQVLYPSASPYVVSVGGTTLPLDSSGNLTGAESAWASGGGGPSASEVEPAYQIAYGITITGGQRGTPDVAYDANPYTGFAVYDSYAYQRQQGWLVFGGTSAGAPQWAGLLARVDQARGTPLSSSSLTGSPVYSAATGSVYASNYRDITSGNNTVYSAGTGYDLATGLGSPLASNLVPYLATH
jgi:subtilase family serine protease